MDDKGAGEGMEPSCRWGRFEHGVQGDEPPPRGGHTTALLPWRGQLGLLVLGGRSYVPYPCDTYNRRDRGRHLGRDDAWIMLLGEELDAEGSG